MPFLNIIEYVPQTYVPTGTIGVVESRAGKVSRAGSYLAPFVECNHFQDGEAFLRGGGQLGRQPEVLSGGAHYDINPHLFEVITVENLAEHLARNPQLDLVAEDLREVEITVGETGVVITHLGGRVEQDESGIGRYVPGHNSFQDPWVFLASGGQLGVQSESLPEGGHYAINPWFAHVVRVPTRNLILEWTKAAKSSARLDASLDQIALDVQGYTVRLDMKQTLRIPEKAAPHLVRRFGDRTRRGPSDERTPVQEFVEKELAPTVTGYFRKISARSTILEFITKYDELSEELFREVRDALAVNGIQAVATTLDEFSCEPEDMNELRRGIALQKHTIKSLEAELDTAAASAKIKRIEIDLESDRRKLELVEIEGLVKLLGPAQISSERLLAELAKAGVPHTIVSGGSDEIASSIMQAIPFNQARDLLLALAGESGRYLAPPEQQQAIESGETQ